MANPSITGSHWCKEEVAGCVTAALMAQGRLVLLPECVSSWRLEVAFCAWDLGGLAHVCGLNLLSFTILPGTSC